MSAIALAAPAATGWLSVGETAARLACSRSVVLRLVRTGRLTSRRLGLGWRRILEADVIRLQQTSVRPAVAE